MSALSLFTIEESLSMLVECREAAEAEGDLAAVAECDKALASYLSQEAAKVNSYAALIRRQIAEAEECEAEAARLSLRAKKRRDFVDRLKATALEVMQRFGVKELRSATNTLRVQKNGGLVPLEIQRIDGIPDEFMIKSFTTSVASWNEIGRWLGMHEGGLKLWHTISGALEGVPPQPYTHEIRKSLAEKVSCPECKGEAVTSGNCRCERCNGTGLVPRTIPGAKLLERGSHVRME